jgi:hypothetical protein
MKPLQHPALTALGATTIIFMVWLAPLASGVHETLFTFPGSVVVVVVPLFIGFFATWAFWFLLLALSQRHRVLKTCVWIALAVLLLRELLEATYTLYPTDDPLRDPPLPSTQVNIIFALAMVVLVAVLLFLRRKTPKVVYRIKSFGTILLGFVAISGAFTLLQVVEYTWQARHLNAPHAMHQTVATTRTPTGRRIVWVLMDELSYRQLYEHRFPDLKLPAFDRLAGESTVFTDARPEGKLTLRIIPALLSGFPDNDIKMPVAGAPLYVRSPQSPRWQQFDEHETVFQDAMNAGYSTSVAGWIFPYCRLLPDVLDHCMQVAPGELVARMNTTQSITWNLKRLETEPLWNRLAMLRLMKRKSVKFIDTPDILYNNLVAATAADINDPSIDFLYFHMNIPHPKGFYNRHTGQFDANNTTYIDNLALCDKYLATIRSMMEANGTWDNTDLVIMGDHSWRVYGWSKDAHWTDEEEKASDGGKFDDRQGYIVHLAGQTTPARIDTPFQGIRTRSLFDALIQGKIMTPQQLAAWAR